MDDELLKAALVALGLREDASLADIRASYLAKTTQGRFQAVILGDEHLERDFNRYYKSYITLLKYYSQSESTDLNFYPQDQIVKFHFNQGLYFIINRDYMKAMEKFQEAHRLDKKDVLVLLYMGILLMKLKNYYAAEKYFLEAVDIDPQSDDGWFYLGENYLKAGELKKALAMFESAKRLNPSRREIAFRLREIMDKMPQLFHHEGEKQPSLLKRIFNKD
ncbi:MAG: tetratricopeptide repeat protein [Candidatus Aminicenantes bacterium]|nr:tetratricopeptide repeat protein [Candidatus Aminicenantes bacterium]